MYSKIMVLISCLFLVLNAGAADWRKFYTESPRQTLALQDTVTEDEEATETAEGAYADYQSAGKAALFSAVVPGSGQLYAGSYWKTLGFVAIEAASWYMYIHYNQRGKDIEDQFEIYADTHWSEDRYWDWIALQSGVSRDDITALRAWEHEHFSHGLHEQKDQQYYEMIGKYDQFNYGWDDVDAALIGEDIPYWRDHRSGNRLYYEGLRSDSNQAFKNATTGVTVAIVNHLISALDAAWTVSRHNKKLAEASLYFQPKQLDTRNYTALTLHIIW